MKKRKYSFFSFYLIILNILIFPFSVSSNERCIEYFQTLKSDYEKYKPELSPLYEFNDFGFKFKVQWNPTKREWDHYQDKDGFYYVGQITNLDIQNKVSINDKIISYNGKDLQDLNLKNSDIFSDNFKDDEEVNFVFQNKNSYNLSLKKKKYDLRDPYADFYIRSLTIDEENEKIEARILLESAHEISEDDSMYELAKELLFEREGDKIIDTADFFITLQIGTTQILQIRHLALNSQSYILQILILILIGYLLNHILIKLNG